MRLGARASSAAINQCYSTTSTKSPFPSRAPLVYNTAMAIPVLIIIGPTGAGKTETAVRAALALDGEVVTADSMQVYRGMDIGTAKPTPEEQQGVPHHLIDIVSPDADFSVTEYVALADKVIADIAQRGKVPTFPAAPGSTLTRSLIAGLSRRSQPITTYANNCRRRRRASGRKRSTRGCMKFIPPRRPSPP